MEEYDFQNIFELMGIESFDDPDYLKSKISATYAKIKNNLTSEIRTSSKDKISSVKKEKEEKIKECQSLNKSNEEIESLRKKYDEEIERLKQEEISLLDNVNKFCNQLNDYVDNLRGTDNIFELLRHYIFLENFLVNDANRSGSINFGKELTEEQKEHKKIVNYAITKFKNPESVEKYVYDKVYPLEYIDVANRDMSKYGHYRKPIENDPNAVPDRIYMAAMVDKPRKVMDTITYSGENLKVYDIGKFEFGQYIKRNEETNKLHVTYRSSDYTIVSVVRTDENGTQKVDSGVIRLNKAEMNENREFYANVVFSDIVMRNANENNFGYIGQVTADEYNEKMLCFEELETEDLVKSLAYAQKYPEISTGKTLPELIKESNKSLLDDKIPNNNDEGGR